MNGCATLVSDGRRGIDRQRSEANRVLEYFHDYYE